MGDREHFEEQPLEPNRARDVVRGAPAGDERLEEEGGHQLLVDEDRDEFRRRWESIQAAFVDEPRRSVEDANRLVSDVTDRVVEGFKAQRGDLETQWSGGRDVSTEDLRMALRRYRSFFDRLLEL